MITDEQIRRLRDAFGTTPDVWRTCERALGNAWPTRVQSREQARTCCAEIIDINARKAQP